jgi:hypothetical protein
MASESNGGKVDKRKTLPQLFTPMTAKQAQQASVRSRNLRKQMRAQLLQAAIEEDIDGLFRQALKKKDLDLLELVEKGMKLTGLDFGSSEEAVQKVDVKADANVSGAINVTVKGFDG